MSQSQARVLMVEDNGGGLWLFLEEDGVCSAAVSGLEHDLAGNMTGALAGALEDGVADWTGLIDQPAKAFADLMAALSDVPGGARLVAESQGASLVLHVDAMGTAARRYAGLLMSAAAG